MAIVSSRLEASQWESPLPRRIPRAADRAYARGWRTCVPSEPRTDGRGHLNGVRFLRTRRQRSSSDHGRETVFQTGNLESRSSVRPPKRIGLTPEAGGRASRPNHALTGVVTPVACASSGRVGRAAAVTTIVRPWFGRGTSNLARQCDRPTGSGLRPRLEDVRPVRTTH